MREKASVKVRAGRVSVVRLMHSSVLSFGFPAMAVAALYPHAEP